jgi:hypothetical protein
MSTSTHFEERLLHELREVVAQCPAPNPASAPAQRRARGRYVLAGAGGLAAALAAVVLFGSGGGTEPAYAVTPRADGSVSVRISSLSDAAGLQRALRAAGVPAVVRYGTGAGTGCPAGPVDTATADDAGTVQHRDTNGGGPSLDSAGAGPAPGTARTKVTVGVAQRADGTTFTINAHAVPSGDTLYITAPHGTVQSLGMRIAKGPLASCPPAPGR